jgi:RNA polymerase sigma factor (sigma-70 family)
MNTCIAQTRPFHQFDADYVQELRNGSSETLEHFVEYVSGILARKFRKHGVAPGAIDDICQETLVRVLASVNSERGLRRPECLGAFAVSVGKNVHREFCRTVSRAGESSPNEDRLCDTAPDPERCALNGEVRQQIQQTLDRLSPTDRQILVMALMEDYPRLDICRMLNIKPAYLPVRLHRAKERFRKVFVSESESWNRHSAFVASQGSAQGAAA